MKRWLLISLTLFLVILCAGAAAHDKTPSKTEVIEAEAFANNASLKNLVLNEGLKRIESKAFAGCTLESIVFPSTIEYIADDAFDWNYYTHVDAVRGTYAWRWAIDHHFLIDVTVEASWLDCYTVSWEPVSGISTYYVLVYKDDQAGDLYESYVVENETTVYVNTDVGTKYYFSVAYFFDDEVAASELRSADPIQPLPAPHNLAWSTLGGNTIRVSWDPVPGATGYRIYTSEYREWSLDTYFFSSRNGSWNVDLADPYYDFSINPGEIWYLWICADNGDGPNYRSFLMIDGNFTVFAASSASFDRDVYSMSTAGRAWVNYSFASDVEGIVCGIDCDGESVHSSTQNLSPCPVRAIDINKPAGEYTLTLWLMTPDGIKMVFDSARLIIEEGPEVFVSASFYPNVISVPLNGSVTVTYAVFSEGCPIFMVYYLDDASGSFVDLDYPNSYTCTGDFTVRGSDFPSTGTYTLNFHAQADSGYEWTWDLVVHVTEETVTDIACEAWLTDTYRLSWSPVSDVTEYTLYAYQDEACAHLFNTVTATEIPYCINTESGIQHYIVIEWEKDGRLYRSDPVTAEPVTALPAPENVSGYIDGDGTVHLSWDEVDGAESYRVWFGTDGIWSCRTEYETAYEPHFEKYDLSEGVTYYFWVCANATEWFNNGYRSDRITLTYVPDPVVLSTPVLTPPNLQQAVWDENSQSIKVTWDSVPDAQGYHVYACTDWSDGAPVRNDGYTEINVVGSAASTAQIPLSSLNRGNYYYVAVNAYAGGYETSPYSNKKLLIVPEPVQEKPHVLEVSRTTWKPDFKESSRTVTVTCDSEYIVTVDISARSWLSCETHGDQLTMTAAKNTTGSSRTGTVRVRCDEHARTETITVTQRYGIDLDAPVVTSFRVEESGGISWLVAKWTSVPNAEQYEVSFSANGNKWETVSKHNSYDREYRIQYYGSSKYYIRVRANNGFDHSEWSEAKYMDSAYVEVESISIDDPGTVYVGDEIELDVTFTPRKPTVKLVRWEIISGSQYAYIADGTLYATKAGQITIKATSACSEAKSDTLTLTIHTPVSSYTPVSRILISGKTNMTEGEEWLFTKSVSPASAAQEVIWTVENGTGTAYIHPSTGMFRALTAGTVYVTAKATDASGVSSLPITVTISSAAVPADRVDIAGEQTLAIGRQTTLTATVYPLNVSDSSVTWAVESGNDAIEILPDGNSCRITATAAGTAVITATASNGIPGRLTVTVSSSVTPGTAAVIQTVEYNGSTIINKKRYASSGSKLFTVATSGSIETIHVCVNGIEVENVVISDNGNNTYEVSNITFEAGINHISFQTAANMSAVSGEFAVYNSADSVTKYVVTEGATIISWPVDSGSAVMFTLSVNDQVESYGSMDNYLYVKYGGKYGWIKDEYLSNDHIHQFTTVTGVTNKQYAYYDRQHHYVSEYDETVICAFCDEQGENVHRGNTLDAPGTLTEHHWNGEICKDCMCDVDGNLKPIQLTLHMESTYWVENQLYQPYVTWEPADLTFEELGIEWAILDRSGKNYTDITEQLVANNSFSISGLQNQVCRFIPHKKGHYYIIVAATSFSEKYALDAIEVVPTTLNEEDYYRLLSAVPKGQNPMYPGGAIYNTIVNEIERCYNGLYQAHDKAVSLANCVMNAPETYRDLYLWSFFDYTRTYQMFEGVSKHTSGKVIVNVYKKSTWFHEAGHAIDYNLTLQYTSTCSKWKYLIYDALYARIYSSVSSKVRQVIAQKGYTLSNSARDKIIEAIMGPYHRYWGWIIPVLDEKYLEPGYGEAQKTVYTLAAEGLRNEEGEVRDDIMYYDMLAGFTNQAVTKDGHGPELLFADQEFYWFKEGTNEPTYYQNMDAWAEYFSSKMTSAYDNTLDFPDACRIMDKMAEELLQGYMNKHRIN